MTTLATGLGETVTDRSARTGARIILRSDGSSALSPGHTAAAPATNIITSEDPRHKYANVVKGLNFHAADSVTDSHASLPY